MSEVTAAPDIADLEIPADAWTQPFWDAASEGVLLLPACAECGRFRWPPGPFCPHCRSQAVSWRSPGPARLYSYTIVRRQHENGTTQVVAPALVEFPDADGVRLLAAIVDTPVEQLQIGAPLRLYWSPAANAQVPVFSAEPDAL
jgi:hypothetical protein